MNSTVYNASLATGIALIGAGVALISVPAALVTVGVLVIGLTVFAAVMMGRKG